MSPTNFLIPNDFVGTARNFFITFVKAYTKALNPVILLPTIKELISFVPS